MSAPAIAFSNVGYERSGRTILERISFEIAPGEFVGVLGENGAGKSTLLKLALGLIAPTSGSIGVFGQPPGRLRGVAGYVPQRIVLDADLPLRARDFVALGVDGGRFGVPWPSAKRRRIVDDVLDAVGARALAERPIGRLSGGEQQRCAIAQAIAAAPKALLLDEPFAALDLRNTAEIVTLIATLARERGIAVLLVAHDINPLLAVMDRIVYLVDGRAAIGTVDEVVNEDTLSRLYDRPVDVLHVRGRMLVVAGAEARRHS